jgi:hypothetical protein
MVANICQVETSEKIICYVYDDKTAKKMHDNFGSSVNIHTCNEAKKKEGSNPALRQLLIINNLKDSANETKFVYKLKS